MNRHHVLALISLDCDGEWRAENAETCLRLESDVVLQELEAWGLVQWLPIERRPGLRVVRLAPAGRRRVEAILCAAAGGAS